MRAGWPLLPLVGRARGRRRAGDAARDAGDWAGAAREYKRYLALRPADWRIRVQLGHALKETGDLQGAEGAYREAAAAAPHDADAALQLGHVLKLRGKLDEAAAAYRRSAALDPSGEAGAELESLQGTGAAGPGAAGAGAAKSAGRDAGDAARDARDWHAAARGYRAHLEAHPRDAAIWVQLGNALKEAGDPLESEAAYRLAIGLNPALADASLQLGHVLKLTGRHEEARAAYQRSVALGAGDAATAELARLDGTMPGAPASSKLPGHAQPHPAPPAPATAPSTAPATPLDRLAAWRALLDAQASRDARSWDAAAALYRTYLEARPEDGAAWLDLSRALRSAGRPHEALDAALQGAMAAPGQPGPLREQVLALRALGRADAAAAAAMRLAQQTGTADMME